MESTETLGQRKKVSDLSLFLIFSCFLLVCYLFVTFATAMFQFRFYPFSEWTTAEKIGVIFDVSKWPFKERKHHSSTELRLAAQFVSLDSSKFFVAKELQPHCLKVIKEITCNTGPLKFPNLVFTSPSFTLLLIQSGRNICLALWRPFISISCRYYSDNHDRGNQSLPG